MGYQSALEAAGATVHVFEQFGSYQGDWWAKVTLPDGRKGWISGAYGSCSGCDAFEGEFGYSAHCDDHYGNELALTQRNTKEDAVIDGLICPQCAKYATKLAAFGRDYFDRFMTQEEAEAHASRNLYWDNDAQKMVDFLKREAIQ